MEIIIGEAANRILKKNKDFKLNNVEKIIGTRNRIIHGYDKSLMFDLEYRNKPFT